MKTLILAICLLCAGCAPFQEPSLRDGDIQIKTFRWHDKLVDGPEDGCKDVA